MSSTMTTPRKTLVLVDEKFYPKPYKPSLVIKSSFLVHGHKRKGFWRIDDEWKSEYEKELAYLYSVFKDTVLPLLKASPYETILDVEEDAYPFFVDWLYTNTE